MSQFLKIMEQRRSQYALGKDLPISDEELIKYVEDGLMYTPTAFNMQSTRAVLVFGDKHEKIWDFAYQLLESQVPALAFEGTAKKLNSFKAAYATILFYEDMSIVNDYASRFSLYKDNFDNWSSQQNAMYQFAIWNILTEHNVGASLQHYNPLIDELVANEFSIDKNYKLIGQMPLGNSIAKPSEKEFINIKNRVQVIK